MTTGGRVVKQYGKPVDHVPAIILLQILEEGKTNQDAAILAGLVRGEISRREAFCKMHPMLAVVSTVVTGGLLLFLACG